MYSVINRQTNDAIFYGTDVECFLFLEKYKENKYLAILKVLEIEGEKFPYYEYIYTRYGSSEKC